ncbi:hypothetical protein LEMLEM_LOCUS12959 [Lemmus lemmus]
MNCSAVSERRKWLEAECSPRTCTTSTNGSATSTNTLTGMGSTARMENWGLGKRRACHPGEGEQDLSLQGKSSVCSPIKPSLGWDMHTVCSQCYFCSLCAD